MGNHIHKEFPALDVEENGLVANTDFVLKKK